MDGEEKENKESGRICPESHLLDISNLLLEISCRIDFPIMDFWQLLKKKKGITPAVEKCDFSVLSENSMISSLQKQCVTYR